MLRFQEVSCHYDDVYYAGVNFADIEHSKERNAIMAMVDACVVK